MFKLDHMEGVEGLWVRKGVPGEVLVEVGGRGLDWVFTHASAGVLKH